MSNFTLSEEEIAEFSRNGFGGPYDLYTPEEMKKSYKDIKFQLMDTSGSIYSIEDSMSGVTNLANYDRHLDIDFLAGHICRPEIVERISSILGNDVLCWRTEFFPKYPGDEGTDWHQAANFANAASSNKPQIEWPEGHGFQGTITVWTAFTNVTIENGCLQFMPGTHRVMNYDESKEMVYDGKTINSKEQKQGIRRGFFGYDYRQLQIDPDWHPDESQARSIEMKAGQFVIFWSTLMHASHPHTSKTQGMRLGYVGRYVPTVVKVYPYSDSLEEYGGKASLEKHGCVLVSGTDRFHHNKFVVQKKSDAANLMPTLPAG